MDQQGQNGLMSTFREGWRSRNWIAFAVAAALIGFYVVLYFTEVFNDIAQSIGLRNKWFFYATLYSIAMIVGAIYYLRRHGNAAYNRKRIAVNLVVQLTLAYTLPFVMPWFFQASPEESWKYEYFAAGIWPLDWYKLNPGVLQQILPIFAVWSIVSALLLSPLMAYFYGKRWYCSWVCGCGGLANTFGDPWRHLTSSSTKSWRFEKQAVYTVMFLAILSTFALFLDWLIGSRVPTFHMVVDGGQWWSVKALYGLVVGSILAGVIGTGLYPLLGPRVWCRNFCPMAAMLGLMQKVGRFRIRVKKDMCISCGNCTTYCEMGIDVRSYAQTNQDFTRSSCVGCGMCAHVCPRGVLKLENVKDLQRDKARQRLPIVDL